MSSDMTIKEALEKSIKNMIIDCSRTGHSGIQIGLSKICFLYGLRYSQYGPDKKTVIDLPEYVLNDFEKVCSKFGLVFEYEDNRTALYVRVPPFCRSCSFFVKKKKSIGGICRRFPPDKKGEFPLITEVDTCGEHEFRTKQGHRHLRDRHIFYVSPEFAEELLKDCFD